jgi:hypothetical protein
VPKADIRAIRQITAVCADDDLVVERIETRLIQSFKDMLQRVLVGDVTLQATSRLGKVEQSIVNQYSPSALARLQTATVLLDSEGELLELGDQPIGLTAAAGLGL